MKELKRLAETLKIPVVILAQTSRSSSSTANMFRNIEPYSDIIACIKEESKPDEKSLHVSIMKNIRGNLADISMPRLNPKGTRYIDFGTLGLKIVEEIFFEPTGEKFLVGSGNGNPGNGGTIIRIPKPDHKTGSSQFAIRGLTRRLLGMEELPFELDIYSLWTHNGKTLREIYDGFKTVEQITKKRRN